jgi:hypothetical protein
MNHQIMLPGSGFDGRAKTDAVLLRLGHYAGYIGQ